MPNISDLTTYEYFPLWCDLGKILQKNLDVLNSYQKNLSKKSIFRKFLGKSRYGGQFFSVGFSHVRIPKLAFSGGSTEIR